MERFPALSLERRKGSMLLKITLALSFTVGGIWAGCQSIFKRPTIDRFSVSDLNRYPALQITTLTEGESLINRRLYGLLPQRNDGKVRERLDFHFVRGEYGVELRVQDRTLGERRFWIAQEDNATLLTRHGGEYVEDLVGWRGGVKIIATGDMSATGMLSQEDTLTLLASCRDQERPADRKMILLSITHLGPVELPSPKTIMPVLAFRTDTLPQPVTTKRETIGGEVPLRK
ncbi:hypothetical protein HY285_04235 [Candidatus Peregrinibacteria bacterium]|nr:hypothetical protein [Candidatus Peregrinibacteria bacterium]MBI3816722.1 hypothetical protein [Candidatus Peregrinibacteria bacterium]